MFLHPWAVIMPPHTTCSAPRHSLLSCLGMCQLAVNKFVILPLVPERWKYSEDNYERVIKRPTVVILGEISQLLVLDSDKEAIYIYIYCQTPFPSTGKKMYSTGLQKPTSLAYWEGIILVLQSSSLYYIDHTKCLKAGYAMTRQQGVDFVTKYNIPLIKIGNMLLTEIKTTIKE